jgi:hypothetical protein
MHLHLRIDSDLVLTRIPIPGRGVLLLPHGDERLEARDRGGEDAVAELELRADVDVRGCEVAVGDQGGRGEVVKAEDYGGQESGIVRIGDEGNGWALTGFGSRTRPRPVLWLSRTSGRP